MQSPRRSMIALAALAAMALYAARADAVTLVTSCSFTCSSNCVLQNDFSCNGQSGVVLNSGADLDMQGHFLTCTSNCPAAAIAITASGSVVNNDTGAASGLEGGVSGAFTTGIDCQNSASSQVRGLRVEDAVNGILNCGKVSNNVVIAPGGTGTGGIITSGVANTDYVRDNYVDGFHVQITVGGSHSNSVQHNSIFMRDVGVGTTEFGIVVNSTGGSVDVLNNSLFGNAAGSALVTHIAGTATFVGNVCDESTTPCTSCTDCSHSTAPFND